MGQPMESEAAQVPSFAPLGRQCVRCRRGRDRRVESGIEASDGRDVDEDSGLPLEAPATTSAGGAVLGR